MSAHLIDEKEIFNTARRIDSPESREAYLQQALGSAPDKLRRVRELLRVFLEAESFLEPPPVPCQDTVDLIPQEQAGTLVGRYQLIELIGEGGMGSVWMAQQTEPVKRVVAVKLVKVGMDSRRVIERFAAERQALALMDHANIARVLDAGATSSGRPYFVMELVKGIPITEYCDQHQLTPRQRIELLIPVCQGVQHAHQKGIIHRDIKPSNVLVAVYDGKPVPKIIDFGVAKATGPSYGVLSERTLSTGFGNIVGTLEYMSPEQAETNQLDVDTRSDIYSIGVLSYELLSGSPPFSRKDLEKAGVLEMLRVIREEEPSTPSTKLSSAEGLPTLAANRGTEPAKLTKLVRGELDWIVMKALEKDRSRRYETANGLALDLQRYLDHEPVSASAPSTMYRLRKFVQRNMGTVLAAAAIFLALVAGSVAAGWGAYRAEIARRDAVKAQLAEAERAEGERLAKEESLRRLAQVVKANEILASIFDNLNPDSDENEGVTLRVLLGERLDHAVSQLEGQATGDPITVAELQSRLGRSLLGLGYADKATILAEKAHDTYERLLGTEHPSTFTSLQNLAVCYQASEKLELAIEYFQKALEFRKHYLGLAHRDTLRTMDLLVDAYREAGRFDLAVPLSKDGFNLAKANLGPTDAQTLTCMNTLAAVYFSAGMLDEALPMLEESLKLRQVEYGMDDPLTLVCMNNLANGYITAGQPRLAAPLLEKAVTLSKGRLGADHPRTLNFINALAATYASDGKHELAVPLIEDALSIGRRRLPKDHRVIIALMENLADCHMKGGLPMEAIPLLEEAVELSKLKSGARNLDTLQTMKSLAQAYRRAHRIDLARPLAEQALAGLESTIGPSHPTSLAATGELACIYKDAGKPELAVPLFGQLVSFFETKYGPDYVDTLTSKCNLGITLDEMGKPDLALPLVEAALVGRKTTRGLDHPETLQSMNALASVYRHLGKLDEAVILLEETLAIRKRTLGSDHPDTLLTMNDLGAAYWAAGNLDRAIILLEETLHLREIKSGRDHPESIRTMANLGLSYRDADRLDEAIQVLEEAHNRIKKLDPLPVSLFFIGDAFAETLDRAGQPAKAEELFRENLAVREKAEPDAWSTFAARSLLGAVLIGQKKYADAEPMLLDGYQGLKLRERAIPGYAKERFTESLQRLVHLYEAWDKPNEANKWRKELEKRRNALGLKIISLIP